MSFLLSGNTSRQRLGTGISNAFGQLETTLALSAAVADTANIPILKGVLTLCLELLRIIKSVKGAQQRSLQLISTCVAYTSAITEVIRHRGSLPEAILSYVNKFQAVLEEIQTSMESIVRLKPIKRFLEKDRIADILSQCILDVERSYSAFKVAVTLHTAAAVEGISTILQDTRRNVEIQVVSRTSTDNVTRDTTMVMTKQYKGADALQSFLQDLEIMNKYPRDSQIRQIFGSSENPDIPICIPVSIKVDYVGGQEGDVDVSRVLTKLRHRNLAIILTEFGDALLGLNPGMFYGIESFGRGILVRILHLKYKKKIKGLADVTARQHSFESTVLGGEVTVEEYFLKVHQIRLLYPDLPLIKVGNALLPPELCMIIETTKTDPSELADEPIPHTRSRKRRGRRFRPVTKAELNQWLRAPEQSPGYIVESWAILKIDDRAAGNHSYDGEIASLSKAVHRFTENYLIQTIGGGKQPISLSLKIPWDSTEDKADKVIEDSLAPWQINVEIDLIIVVLLNGAKNVFRAVKELSNRYNIPTQCIRAKTLQISDIAREEKMFASLASEILVKVKSWPPKASDQA